MKNPNVNKNVNKGVTTVDGARELTTDELDGAAGGFIPALLMIAGCYKAGEMLGEFIASQQ